MSNTPEMDIRPGVTDLARWIMDRNPLYLVSAALVLFGVNRALSATGHEGAMLPLACALGTYALLLGLAAVVILRVTSCWDDLRSMLLILLLVAAALTMVFDERIAAAPGLAAPWSLCVFGFILLVGLGLDRLLGLGLPAWFQVVLHGQFALFVLASWLMARHPGSGAWEWAVKTWVMGGLSASSGLLAAVQALLVRPAWNRSGACPWPHPWHPHVAGLALCALAAVRLWALDYVYGGSGPLLERWQFAPPLFGAGLLLLRLALAAGWPRLATAALFAVSGAVLVALPEANRSALPCLLALPAALAVHAHAWRRGVPWAEGLFWLTLLGGAFGLVDLPDPSLDILRLPHPKGCVLLAAAAGLGWRAWSRGWAWPLLGAGLLAQFGLGDLRAYADWAYGLHWTAAACLLLLRACRLPRRDAARLEVPAVALLLLLFGLELCGRRFSGGEPVLRWGFLALLPALSLAHGLRIPSVAACACAAVQVASLLAWGALEAWRLVFSGRLASGMLEIAAGFLVLGLAVLVSMRRSRVLAAPGDWLRRGASRLCTEEDLDGLAGYFRTRMAIPGWMWLAGVGGVLLLLLWPMCTSPTKPAYRCQISSDLKNLASGCLIQANADPHPAFRGVFASPKGIRALRPGEAGLAEVDGTILHPPSSRPEPAIFEDLRGRHPWGGCYWFLGVRTDGTAKAKYSSTDRIVLEIPGPKTTDGQISIAFADAHVTTFPAPDRPLTFEDVRAILSVQGEESLWGGKVP